MALTVELRKLRDRLTARAIRRSLRVEQLAADQAAPLLRAVTAGSRRIQAPADDDTRGMVRAARRLRSQDGIGATITRSRSRAREFVRMELSAAVVSGYGQDQKQRSTLYQAATADFIAVELQAPAAGELTAVGELTVNGRTSSQWGEIESTSLWSATLGAFASRVTAESGGWESGLRLLSTRIGTAFDTYASRVRDLAYHFYMTGVLASGRQVAAAFEETEFIEDPNGVRR